MIHMVLEWFLSTSLISIGVWPEKNQMKEVFHGRWQKYDDFFPLNELFFAPAHSLIIQEILFDISLKKLMLSQYCYLNKEHVHLADLNSCTKLAVKPWPRSYQMFTLGIY